MFCLGLSPSQKQAVALGDLMVLFKSLSRLAPNSPSPIMLLQLGFGVGTVCWRNLTLRVWTRRPRRGALSPLLKGQLPAESLRQEVQGWGHRDCRSKRGAEGGPGVRAVPGAGVGAARSPLEQAFLVWPQRPEARLKRSASGCCGRWALSPPGLARAQG